MNEIADRLDGARERLRARQPPGEARLLTARTVAERLEVSAETILRWVRQGKLPAIRLPSGAIRIPEPQLEEWLAARGTSGEDGAPANGV